MAEKLKGPAIGIDLGTSYCCVGVWKENKVEIVVDAQGNRTTPSCVAFSDTKRLVGDAAENQCNTNPTNTIFGVKCLIGRKFNDPDVQGRILLYPFEITEGPKGEPIFVVNYNRERKTYNAEEISSIILDNLRMNAEKHTERTVKNAVVTVPAHFNSGQRRATRTAGQMAGLNVMRIISEPTAAAIAYGMHNLGNREERNVLVFDLGGGTLDVSIVNIRRGQLKVKATAGDTYLGGEDFTNKMVEYFMKMFSEIHKKDLSGNPKAIRRLRTACEKAKRVLSYDTETTIELDCLHEGIDFQPEITRSTFEDLNKDLFQSCMHVVEKCISDVNMRRGSIHNVLLVGGSTRIRKVKELLQEFFHGTRVSESVNPDEIVAHGATMLAAKLVGERGKDVQNLQLHDVTPLSLGIEKIGKTMRVLIPKNTPIPTSKDWFFTTVHDNQSRIRISVYEGEWSMVEKNNFLGQFELDSISSAVAGTKIIIVRFDIDADGVLTISAKDRESGLRKEITVSDGKSTLGMDEIERLVSFAEVNREEDENQSTTAVAKVNLKNLISNLRTRLRTYSGENKNSVMREIMEKEIVVATAWLESNQEAKAEEFDYMRTHLCCLWNELGTREKGWSGDSGLIIL